MRIVALVVSALVLAVAGSAHGATQGCDAATATPLVQEAGTNPRVVEAVHCGAFLGPGSDAMVVEIASQGGCAGIMGWRLFTRTNGIWQSVEGFRAAPHLRVEGTNIVEWREVHRRADWVLCGGATGGEQERSWTWNGAALTPGPWTQTVPARPKGEVARFARGTGVSFSALGRFQCSMQDRPRLVFAECSYRRPPIKFGRVEASGRMRTCDDIGPYYGCEIGDPGEGDIPYTLRRNQSVIVGRFRCRSGRTTMRCTVVRSGRGFVLDRNGPRAIR